MEYIPLLICAIGQGLFKSCSDSIISWKWGVSFWSQFDVNGYFGISNNQKNKYAYNKILNWLYRNPLVALSDFWHGANMLQMLFQVCSLYFALTLPINIDRVLLVVIGYWLVSRATFHIFYTYIFLNKKYDKS
jgi:hypothetical protein